MPNTSSSHPLPLEIEVEDYQDDSAYGDEIQSYTTSLKSSAFKYEWENGRRYHSFKEGSYQFPNDEKEQDRLDLMHHLIYTLLGNKLHLAPITSTPQRILDVGTGTGIWAIEAADLYPSAQVLGNDLSPIQPSWVPPNVSFEVDDCESPWPTRESFDFIHLRYMAGSIKDWTGLMRQCYEQTKPGGWVECQDFDVHYYSEDNSHSKDNKVVELCRLLIEGCEKIGRTACPGPHLKGWVESAGFVNIHNSEYRIPLGVWPKDEKMKKIGACNAIQMSEGIEAFTLAIFTRVLGWTPEEVQVFLGDVRKDIGNKSAHLMCKFYVAYGQRPEV